MQYYRDEKFNNYIERSAMAHERYENYTKTNWKLEDTMCKLNNIVDALKKQNANMTTVCCAICMENVTNKTVVQTKCNHTFCYDCIENNKKYNQSTGNLCGLCRENIFN